MSAKAQQLKHHIEELIHRLMIVENRFLETNASKLSNTEMKVIDFIGKEKECTMSEIAEHLMFSKTNLTAIVDKLVRKKMVQRDRSEEDRRLVLVSLTSKGLKLYEQESENHLRFAEGMLQSLDSKEQDELLQLLSKITSS
jgi:DNA-binding MarR family transcriptional regulator